jgi:hypothetical protein
LGFKFFLERFRPKELVDYKPYTPKDSPEPIPLNGKIIEGRVARFWNRTIPEMKEMSKKDQVEAFGIYYIEQEIERYNNSEQMKRLDKKRK